MKRLLDNLKRFTKTIWPAILWSALIFVLLMIPSSQLPSERLIPIPYFDKIVHFILFGVFAYLWNNFLSQLKFFAGLVKRLGMILFAILIYGLFLEFLQLYTGRNFDWWDLMADGLGILVIINPGLMTRVKK